MFLYIKKNLPRSLISWFIFHQIFPGDRSNGYQHLLVSPYISYIKKEVYVYLILFALSWCLLQISVGQSLYMEKKL